MRQRTPSTPARDPAPPAPRKAFALAAVLGTLALPIAPEALAADPDPRAREMEAKVEVAYVYNFPRFLEWPDDDDGEKVATAPIRLCVIGSDPIRAKLGELSGRDVKGRPIEVAHVEDADASLGCRVLFITRSEEPRLPILLPRVGCAPVLTVSDIPRFARRGGMVGFVTEDGRVKLEINLRLVRKAGLRISAKVLEIARVVE